MSGYLLLGRVTTTRIRLPYPFRDLDFPIGKSWVHQCAIVLKNSRSGNIVCSGFHSGQ